LSSKHTEHGFSLMETLVALIIMSMASLALFQSTSSMLSLSDRAVRAGEDAVDQVLDRHAILVVLNSLVPNWPESSNEAFIGDEKVMQGFSSAALSNQIGLNQFTLRLVPSASQEGNYDLTYVNAHDPRQTNELGPQQLKDKIDNWTLWSNVGVNASFAYQGLDGRWYQKWPPIKTPVTPYFNDAEFFTPPVLPQRIKLHSQGDHTQLIVAIDRHHDLPPRTDIGRDVF